jgi:hypothetical protein
MSKVHFKIAPDIEVKVELDVEGIDPTTRDYDVQQHKAEVYEEFEKRIRQAFPEGYRIDTFEFGLDHEDLL